jgi:hypothetical protein
MLVSSMNGILRRVPLKNSSRTRVLPPGRGGNGFGGEREVRSVLFGTQYRGERRNRSKPVLDRVGAGSGNLAGSQESAGAITMTNFAIYMIGVILAAGALVYGLHRAGVGEPWVWIGLVALIGLGIMGGIVKTRGRGG